MSARRIPTRRLPAQPNLQQLRKQAKELGAETGVTLHQAQRDLARAYGFDSWPKLKALVDGANVARLADAVKAGDLATVRTLLKARPELIAMDMAENDEHRALHFAVLRRDPAMVRLLMQAGADARKGIFPHRDATSAIALARDRECPEIVAIIEEEERKRSPSADGPAPAAPPHWEQMDAAIRDDNQMLVRELVARDPAMLTRDTNWRRGGYLSLAVRHGQIAMVRLLLDLGADVNERTMLEEVEAPVESAGQPLWNAAAAGRRDIAELLLDRGADPNANPYASGWAIDHAVRRQDAAMKELLLARGAQMKPWTVTLAHDADAARRMLAADGSEEVARELVWAAACNGCPEIVELALPRLRWPRDDPRWNWILIQPPRSAGENGVEDAYFTCMELLLAHGIEPNTARSGATVLHFIAARGTLSAAARVRFTAMLLDAGAFWDLRDDLLRSTPLAWACRWGRKEMVELLLARGAPADEPDAEPWATPLAWATKMGHTEIAALLEGSCGAG